MNFLQSIHKILTTLDRSQNQQQHNNNRQSNTAQKEKRIDMKLCQTIQKNMAAMGFTPHQQQNNHLHLSSGQTFGIVKCSMDIITIGLYVIRKANRIDEYIDSGFILTVAIGFAIVFISLIFNNDKLFNMIELTAKELTFRSNNNPSTRAMYEKANRLVEKLSKIIYFVAINLGVPCFILPKAIISYFKYFNTDAGSEAFEQPFPSCFPFDWKNPIGYLFVMIWEYVGAFIVIRLIACVVPLVLAYFLISFSITKDWKNDIRTLDKMAKAKKSDTNIFKQLTHFIRSHSKVKQLVNDFMDIFEVAIFTDIIGCTIALCVVMMMIQVEILVSKDIVDPEMLWKSIFYGCWVFGLIFFSCELGQLFTNLFEQITDRFDRLNWYIFPMKVQRLLPTILINTQEPIVIGCFGMVNGSRDQFKKVVDIAYKSFGLLINIYN